MQPAVPHHQHPSPNRAQQPPCRGCLAGAVGAQNQIAQHGGPGFDQPDQPHLGKGARLLAAVGGWPPEGARIRRRVRQVERTAVDGHQPQAEPEGAGQVWRGGRAGQAPEQQEQRPWPEPLAGLGQGRLGRQVPVPPGGRVPLAQAVNQVGQDVAQPIPSPQAHRNHQRHDQAGWQQAAPLLACPGRRDHLVNRRLRQRQAQRLQKRSIGQVRGTWHLGQREALQWHP